MKTNIIAFLALFLWLQTVCFAAGDVDEHLNRAVDHLAEQGYMGDTSTAQRYLQAILDVNEDHLEANWLFLYINLVRLTNVSLINRASGMHTLGPIFNRVVMLAKKSNQKAFLHYTTAVYAMYYHAFDRALAEIDKALAIEPNSTRYQYAKARILINYGSWHEQDETIEKGIALLRETKQLAQRQPDRFTHPAFYDFNIASGISNLSEPRWEEVVEHYLRFLVEAEPSIPYAFAWNNASIAYRQLGQCSDAKEAAEHALKVMKFGAAVSNKRYADFCIEMQKLGITENKEDPTKPKS